MVRPRDGVAVVLAAGLLQGPGDLESHNQEENSHTRCLEGPWMAAWWENPCQEDLARREEWSRHFRTRGVVLGQRCVSTWLERRVCGESWWARQYLHLANHSSENPPLRALYPQAWPWLCESKLFRRYTDSTAPCLFWVLPFSQPTDSLRLLQNVFLQAQWHALLLFFSPSGLLCVMSCKVMIMMGVTVMMMVVANFT